MKLNLLLCCLFSQFIATELLAADPASIRVMTFNVRYGTAPDGQNVWENRKPLVKEFLQAEKPQVLGLQEALRDQWEAIIEMLPNLVAVGVGRESDGGGEYSALLYDFTRFDLMKADTYWLSDTPEVRGSKSWGNNYTRVCTWARLVDRSSNREFTVMNTHWDHESQPARLKSGQLMAERVKSLDPSEPVIVTGDFNIGPTNPARQALTSVGLRDSFADLYPEQANVGTFHAFTGKPTSDKIDAILISKQWQVTAAEIVRTERDGVYLSDHYPVMATLVLKPSP